MHRWREAAWDAFALDAEENTGATSHTTSNPVDAQDPEATERKIAENLLAMSSGQKPPSTRPTTICLNFRRTGSEDPEVDDSEIEDKPVETKRRRKSQGTRRTTTSSGQVIQWKDSLLLLLEGYLQ